MEAPGAEGQPTAAGPVTIFAAAVRSSSVSADAGDRRSTERMSAVDLSKEMPIRPATAPRFRLMTATFRFIFLEKPARTGLWQPALEE
jgi:ABC-type transporter Mla maintaining outer membrane lipid asymmetry permease subunit MlaE